MTDTNVSIQNGQGILPSIEITEYDESPTAEGQSTQTTNRSDNARNASRRRVRSSRGFWKKKRLPTLLKLILLTFVPHILFGSAMFILGYVSWEIRNDTNNDEKRSEVLVALFQSGKLNFNPMIFTDVFAISCIGIGIEFIFSGVSGFLTVRQKLKEYVHCHILWLSLSALSSLLLIASCSFGLRESRNLPRGLSACIYSAIATSAAEALCIIYNFYAVTYHLKNCPGQERPPSIRNADSTSGGRTQAPSGPAPSETSELSIPNDRTNQIQHSPTLNGRISNRRPATAQGYHGRRRRSGQAGIRDRMHLLHPGINPSGGRNRLRRRPILRAQNHYVSIPIACGRPRAASRSRNQNVHPPSRRNGGEVPMFVIANHNRYVQELNQSMENLESTANRGSVPGDAFPLINAVEASTIPKTVLQKSKSVDVACSNRGITPPFLGANSLQENVCQGLIEQKIEASSNVNDQNMLEGKQSVSHRRKVRDNLGYSVVMKTKRSECGPKRLLKNVRSVDDEVTRNRLHHEKRNFSVSAVEDAVFHDVEHENMQRRHRFICPARPDEVSQKPESTIHAQSTLKCGYTASGGGFNNLPYSDIANKRPRNCQTSVSSDSIILKSESETRFTSNHSPNSSHNEEAIEMNDFATRDFGLSPVSNTTPSYENMSEPATELAGKFKF